jgi:TRAP-type mannitol/chloroaromatic compound transport system permease small subunit
MEYIVKIARIIEKVNNFLGQIAYILIGVQAGFMVLAIFMRYVLNNPFKAATEIDQLIIVFVSLLGCAYVLKTGGHIHVEIFVDRLKPRVRDFVIGINYMLFGIPYCGIIIYFFLLFVQSSYSINEHTQGAYLLLWPIKSLFLVGFTLLGLQFLISGIRLVHRSIMGRTSNGV